MPLNCHECHHGVQNPFYVMHLVLQSGKKIALSENEYNVCRADIDFVKSYASGKTGAPPIAFGIDKVTGIMGGPSNLLVVDIAQREEKYTLLSKELVLRLMPKTANSLLKNPQFVEPGAEKKPAGWAQKVYEFLLAEQSKNLESSI